MFVLIAFISCLQQFYIKILVLILIFLGEALAIYAEMTGARMNQVTQQPFLQIFLKMFLIIIIGSGLLIAGYMLGFESFKNIWIVSVISITSILIIEPILALTIFKQMPTTGALIGLVLGIIGIIAAIFF